MSEMKRVRGKRQTGRRGDEENWQKEKEGGGVVRKTGKGLRRLAEGIGGGGAQTYQQPRLQKGRLVKDVCLRVTESYGKENR